VELAGLPQILAVEILALQTAIVLPANNVTMPWQLAVDLLHLHLLLPLLFLLRLLLPEVQFVVELAGPPQIPAVEILVPMTAIVLPANNVTMPWLLAVDLLLHHLHLLLPPQAQPVAVLVGPLQTPLAEILAQMTVGVTVNNVGPPFLSLLAEVLKPSPIIPILSVKQQLLPEKNSPLLQLDLSPPDASYLLC